MGKISRADEQVRWLFRGVVPERRRNLKRLFRKYQPRFWIVDEIHEGEWFVLQGGQFANVEFNDRAMRITWLGAFAAWEAFSAAQHAFTEMGFDRTRFNADRLREVLATIDQCMAADDSYSIALPRGIPEPGRYLPRHVAPEGRAAGELATLAAGWAMLHEIRHLIHQQKGTGALDTDPPERQHAEEFSCDAFATAYLLRKVEKNYSRKDGVAERVANKRHLGVLFGIFALATISADSTKGSKSHPPLQMRLNAVLAQLNLRADSRALMTAWLAFKALAEVRNHTPVICDSVFDDLAGRQPTSSD